MDPDRCNDAAASPATRAAPEKPRPLPGGIEVSENKSPAPPAAESSESWMLLLEFGGRTTRLANVKMER